MSEANKDKGRLTIGRKAGQAACIGDDIMVTVRSVADRFGNVINGCNVRLSICAPKSVRIDREEVRLKLMPISEFQNSPRLAASKKED